MPFATNLRDVEKVTADRQTYTTDVTDRLDLSLLEQRVLETHVRRGGEAARKIRTEK